jgi:lysophospholipase L1-like esterase
MGTSNIKLVGIIGLLAGLVLGHLPVRAEAADATDWADLKEYQADNAEVQKTAPRDHRVVFMGDSITQFWDQDQHQLFADPHYINRGISGQTTPQMLLRFRQDVIALRPEVVVILGGTNDISGNTGPATDSMIEDNLASMSDLARQNNIKVVFGLLLPAARYPWAPDVRPAPRITAINQWLKDYAKRNNIAIVDYYTPMATKDGALRSDYSEDGVHPVRAGYEVMEKLVKNCLALLKSEAEN